MARPDPLTADVLIAAEIPPQQELAIIETFGAFGVVARTRIVPARRGPGELQWLLLAVLPLQAFLSSLGSSVADEVFHAFKRLIGRAHGTRSEVAAPRSVLILQDAATRLQVVLEADLPTDAYTALLSLDLSNFHKGPLHYDRHRSAWRSELDEWHQQRNPLPKDT